MMKQQIISYYAKATKHIALMGRIADLPVKQFVRIFSAILLVLVGGQAFATTFEFDCNCAGSRDWTDESMWSPYYPGTSIGWADDVNILSDCVMDVDIHIYGYLRVTPGISFEIPSGKQLSIGGTVSVLGILTNNGNMVVNGELIVDQFFFPQGPASGTFYNNGTMNAYGTSGNSLFIDAGCSVISNGTLHCNGGYLHIYGDLVNNGIFSSGQSCFVVGGSSGTFTHNGTSATISSSEFDIDYFTINSGKTVHITSTGTFNILVSLEIFGTLNNEGFSSSNVHVHSSGNFINNGYAGIRGINEGTMTLNGTTRITGPGSTNLNNLGDITLNSGETLSVWPTHSITHNGSSLTINGTLDNWGTGTVTVNAGKTLSVNGSGTFENEGTANIFGTLVNGGTFTNDGTANISGTLNNSGSGSVTVSAGKNLTINSGGTLTHNGAAGVTVHGTLTNEGTVNVANFTPFTVGSGGTFVHNGTSATVSGFLNNSGTVTVETGKTLAFNGLGTFNNFNILNGGGTIGGSSSSFSSPANSTVAPGSSPGCLTIDKNFTNSGTLQIELGDGAPCVGYDQMQVNGNANINGNIVISFVGGTVPIASSFTILNATGSLSGTPNFTWPVGVEGSYAIVGNELQVSFVSLPVELAEFRGNALADQNVRLFWRTGSETNNEGFDVLRSGDGRQWESIGFVAGSGTSLEEESYTFTDEHPLPGLNYYRLKQIDFDGTFEFSKTIGVESRQEGGSMSLFPNPVTTVLNLRFETDYFGEATFILIDPTGRLVKSQAMSLDGSTIQTRMELDGLPAGIYLARLNIGREQWEERILVN